MWGAGVTLMIALTIGGFFAFSAAPAAHAAAITGCRGKQLASAQTTANGYILTVSVVAQYGIGGDFGTGYCGSMNTSATFTVPAGGAGGPLTVTIIGSTSGPVSNTFNFPNAGTSSYTFTENSPSIGDKCGTGTATFTSSSGLTLTATTNKACAK
jgi:hypothetical protein